MHRIANGSQLRLLLRVSVICNIKFSGHVTLLHLRQIDYLVWRRMVAPRAGHADWRGGDGNGLKGRKFGPRHIREAVTDVLQ